MPVTPPLADGSQPERDGDGFVIVEQQRRQRSPGAELVAARGSRGRMHGISQAAQTIDIATQGSCGDVEPMRQFGSGPVALHLKERQQAKQPSRGLQHDFIVRLTLCHGSRTESVLNR